MTRSGLRIAARITTTHYRPEGGDDDLEWE
jgi:hypothetical protein